MAQLKLLLACLALFGSQKASRWGTSSAPLFAASGSNITLPCNLSATGNAQISWEFKGNSIIPISNHLVFSTGNLTLIIVNVTNSDSGVYKCINGQESYSIELSVAMESPLVFKSVFSSVSVVEGDPISLECSVSGYPLLDLSWSKNSRGLSNISRVKIEAQKSDDERITNSTLSIASAISKDNGTYHCMASSGAKLISHSASVIVRVKPSLLVLAIKDISGLHATVMWSRLSPTTFDSPYQHDVQVLVTKDGVAVQNSNHTKSEWNSSVVIVGLEKSTSYKVQAREVMTTGAVGPWSAALEFTTTNAVLGAVVGLKARPATTPPKAVQLDWLNPVVPGIVIKKFRIQYSYTDSSLTIISHTKVANSTGFKFDSHVLKGLQPYTIYTIVVQVSAVDGAWGESASVVVRTKEFAAGEPPKFVLVDVAPDKAFVAWNSVPVDKQNGIISHYVLRTESTAGVLLSQQQFNLSLSRIQVNLTDLYPNTRYQVIVYAVNGAGDGQKASISFTTLEDKPSEPGNLLALPLDGFSVKISWREPNTTHGVLRQFQIVWRKYLDVPAKLSRRSIARFSDEKSESGNIYGGQQRHYVLHGLDPFSKYEIKVRERTSAGWGAFSLPTTVKTLEAAPGPVGNVTNLEQTTSSLTLFWIPPPKPNGIINYYNVHLRDRSALLRSETVPSFADNGTGVYLHKFDSLKADFLYYIQVQAFNTYPGDSGPFYKMRTKSTDTGGSGFPWLHFSLGFVGALLLIGIVLVMYLFYSRKKTYQEVGKDADEIPLEAVVKSKVISVSELRNYCMQNHSNSDHGFYTEYESSRVPANAALFKWEHSQESCNQMKNRYSNIVAYDHTRVPLTQIDGDPSTTYINASYIDGYQQPRKYIATQGPLPHTINDFWRMVWEQNSHVIVMLTRLIEDSRVKCEQYWPIKGAARYGDIVVTIIGTTELSDYIVRTFSVHSVIDPGEGKREVKQFHFTAWPDHGVPSHPTAMVAFVRHVMSAVPDRPWPVVIHCSAGVGRTGTFIVIEANLCRMKEEHSVDVLGFVVHIRTQRNFMVQTEGQYIFIYDALLDAVVCGDTEIAAQDICAKLRHLNETDPDSGESYLMAEFKRLESGTVSAEKQQSTVAMLPENKNKNRFFNVLPFDKNRVRLTPNAASKVSDYINASFIDGYQQRQTYIASQAPLPNTIMDFWQMIWEHDVSSVVMLTKLEEKQQEKCVQYWPQEEAEKFGRFHVEILAEKDYGEFLVKELRLSDSENGKSRLVKHFLFLGWPEYRSPTSGREMIELIGQVQRSQQSTGNGPILVHCSGGVGRTGSYIAMSISIERLKVEGTIDLFQTVRALRMQRPAMVQTVDQYSFCYLALNDYMDSFDLYSNFK